MYYAMAFTLIHGLSHRIYKWYLLLSNDYLRLYVFVIGASTQVRSPSSKPYDVIPDLLNLLDCRFSVQGSVLCGRTYTAIDKAKAYTYRIIPCQAAYGNLDWVSLCMPARMTLTLMIDVLPESQ